MSLPGFRNQYPVKYPGFAGKVCPACMDNGRFHVVLKPFLMRAVDEDYGTMVLACPRCLYQDPAVTRIELSALSVPAITPRY